MKAILWLKWLLRIMLALAICGWLANYLRASNTPSIPSSTAVRS